MKKEEKEQEEDCEALQISPKTKSTLLCVERDTKLAKN